MTTPNPARQLPSKVLVIFKILIRIYVLATDGCFYNDAAFMVCSPPDTGELEMLFRYEVFKMLKAEGKITDE